MGWDAPSGTKLELKGQPIVGYDLEIKNPIDGKEITWSTHDRMGISVGVAFDYRTGDFTTYFDDNMADLASLLNGAGLIVGFNHIGFDNSLLRASGFPLKPDSELRQYDMLVESRRAMGWRPGDRFPSGMKLDNHLEVMFGIKKTSHGEEAPHMYQRREWGKLTSYCIADVRRECMLFEHIWNEGWTETLAHGRKLCAPPQKMLA
jgi:DEAD/DEAH box helicase domain-containing protein